MSDRFSIFMQFPFSHVTALHKFTAPLTLYWLYRVLCYYVEWVLEDQMELWGWGWKKGVGEDVGGWGVDIAINLPNIIILIPRLHIFLVSASSLTPSPKVGKKRHGLCLMGFA